MQATVASYKGYTMLPSFAAPEGLETTSDAGTCYSGLQKSRHLINLPYKPGISN